ncbi:MAG: hypothetical protein JW741_06565, partial [Sedimentisphaerales bacterium]|nr:hypothetical protein [Sedimentisphaerales bacterium]
EKASWRLRAASDTKSPNGVPYYVVKNATTGFNGGNPSGFSDCVGIDASTEEKWRNYTDTYSQVTKDDLVASMRKAHRLTGFKSPVSIPDFRRGKGNRYRVYMNEATINSWELLAEAQNDQLGRDLAPMDGVTAFKRHPVIYVAQLDDDTSNPVYMLDHNTFYPVVLKGDYLRETEPISGGVTQHNSFVVYLDLTFNLLCLDRRRNTVIYVA